MGGAARRGGAHRQPQRVVRQQLQRLHAALVGAEPDQRLHVLGLVGPAGHHHVAQLQRVCVWGGGRAGGSAGTAGVERSGARGVGRSLPFETAGRGRQ